MPAPDPLPDPDPLDPLGLTRAAPAPPLDRAVDLLGELGVSPRAALGVAVAGLVAVLGWWWLRAPGPTAADAAVPLAPAASSGLPGPTSSPAAGSVGAAGTVPVGEVTAHAAGAVRRPGLYRLPVGARVDDLLRAAGGAGPQADLDRVNLAAPVVDGSQVYVPRRGEAAPAVGTTPAGDGGTTVVAGPVNVNQAGPEELETLPGVGPATAAAIIEYREANGGFASVDQLIDVPGIGEAKLAAIADLVTV